MVTVNGEKMDLDGRALGEFLLEAGYGTVGVAVERNGTVVPGRELDQTFLSDGDVLEIVRFVGGG
ncbi:MAG: sulfur carrier protein ThiS [Oscillospiraceae bacterium]|nr:sulfur carrier protein ThiS [Oscillospiraceae bacterium]